MSVTVIFTMKGVDEIRNFLKSGKDFSASKDALPHPQVDREALIKVLLELHAENLALKANMPKVTPAESSSVTMAGGFTGLESVAGATSSSNTAGDVTPLSAKASASTSTQNEASTEKPEKEKLCRVMWGKYPCPGEGCNRVHLKWCANPQCLISEERSKQCKLWHGHLRVALQREKAKKKKEAVQRAAEAEQREFREWKKQKNPAPGNSAKTKGHKGDPKGRQEKPTQQKGKSGQPGQQKGWKQQKGRTWTPPGPRAMNLGDYFPPLPAPKKPAWMAPVTTAMAPASGTMSTAPDIAKEQLRRMLEFQLQLLQI